MNLKIIEECKGDLQVNESANQGLLESLSCISIKGIAMTLVVDDDLMNIDVLQAMLCSLNVKSDKALSGEIALKLIQDRIQSGEGMYKLILLDYSMPGMNGPETARVVRAFLEEK